MKTIKKNFETIKQAENYLMKLYNKYNFVELKNSPLYSENGIYIFNVK